MMRTELFEIAPSIFTLRVIPTDFFCYNSFLIVDEHPLLIHTGRAKYFPSLLDLLRRVIPIESLSRLAFSHFEADECGAINLLLDHCPHLIPLVGSIGRASIEDISKVPPLCLEDGEEIILGENRLQFIHTPHCPHGWDACLVYDPKNKILFSSDLGAHPRTDVQVTDDDVQDVALKFQDEYGFLSIGEDFKASLNKILSLDIKTVATQHGGIITGKAAKSLLACYLLENNQRPMVNRRKVGCEDF